MLAKQLFLDFNITKFYIFFPFQYIFSKIGIYFLIYNFPLFYNVPLFSVESAFCNKFIVLFLQNKLIIQQQTEPLMFKIAILLRLIDIINKS